MQIIEQSWEWMQKPENTLQLIERAARTCYKSEDKITDDSAEKMVRMLVKSGHFSTIEHVSASIKIITDRGNTHELVRHRLASYSQESTRYVNYSGDDIKFIKPVWFPEIVPGIYRDDWMSIYNTNLETNIVGAAKHWIDSMIEIEKIYKTQTKLGMRPEQARAVLPNSLKTEIVVTANLRNWQHIFSLRCSKKAHPQIRTLMVYILHHFKKEFPIIFDDL